MVQPRGRAALAGLLEGDCILEINDFSVTNVDDVVAALNSSKCRLLSHFSLFSGKNKVEF
jgi:S1-C subfamily serine protease